MTHTAQVIIVCEQEIESIPLQVYHYVVHCQHCHSQYRTDYAFREEASLNVHEFTGHVEPITHPQVYHCRLINCILNGAMFQVLSGLVKMIGRAMPAVVTRNAVVGIHGFTVEEKGRMYLRSQNLQLIRAMLGGLLLHSQSQHTTNNHPDDGHVLTAQIANGCLRNLRDSGEECWPRWINGLTLPREYEMSAVEV